MFFTIYQGESMPSRIFLAFFVIVCGKIFLAHASPEETQGYDSPVDPSALHAEQEVSAGVPPYARRPSEIPWAYEPQRRVYDFARVLPEAERKSCNDQLIGTSLTVVTMPYRDGEPLEEYANRVRDQFGQRIPESCQSPTTNLTRAAWEERCFIAMPHHDLTEETVLVYDPHHHASAISHGTRPVPPEMIEHMLRLLKRPYRPSIALAGYTPEPPRIGRNFNRNYGLEHRRAVTSKTLSEEARLIVFVVLITTSILSVGSLTYLFFRYRKAALPTFQPPSRRLTRPVRYIQVSRVQTHARTRS